MAAKKGSSNRLPQDSDEESLREAEESEASSGAKDFDREIAEYKKKIRALEAEKAAAEFSKTELCSNLKATQAALSSALEDMDGRAQVLSAAFVRASRQYLTLLERQIEEALGKRRRGRKPKSDLGL